MRVPWIRTAAALLLLAPLAAGAGDLASAPISHGAGFQSVTCHFVNVHPSKPLVVEEFFIDDVDSSTSFGAVGGGLCTGLPPWTVPPERGCSRELSVVSACDPPNSCYGWVRVKGSAKWIRGRLVGTVSGSTVALTADLE